MKSMTGFGREVFLNESFQIEVEIKSVNQRFLDLQFRMPKEMNVYELAIRDLIRKVLYRGRIEIYVNVKKTDSSQLETVIRWPLIHSLIKEIQTELSDKYENAQLSSSQIMQQIINNQNYIEIVENSNLPDTFESIYLEIVQKALVKLNDSRQIEGEKIQKLLYLYSGELYKYFVELSKFKTEYENEHLERLKAKLSTYTDHQIEDARLLTEVLILLEKGDIQEEIDRLMIHYRTMENLFGQDTPIGRELDFLVQEMNREINTIGSKSNIIEIKNNVVQMKTILEKIREQIQNIE